MKNRSEKITALLNLLEDEDSHVSTLAMEQLLQENTAEDLIKEFQEANNPLLRNRIHQLGNVLNLRRRRIRFIRDAKFSRMSLLEGLMQINYQFNPRMSAEAVKRAFRRLQNKVPQTVSTVRMATFMREHSFSYTGEDTLGSDLFLIEDVLAQRVGSPVLLSVITKCLGQTAGWKASIVLYKGKHSLLDINSNLVEPSEDWKVTHLPPEDRLEACADNDIWLTVMSQLFLAAMLEGRLQAIHRVGSILAGFCGGTLNNLPYPLGNDK